MPKRYLGIKRSQKAKCKKSGGSEAACEKRAKTSAAKIYNATRKKGEKPVTRKSH
jgi:hypothetical protein